MLFYLRTGGKKYGFTSQEVFWGLGYSFANLVSAGLSGYELGGLVDIVDRPHPDGSLITDGQTIWFVNNGIAQGFVSMEEFTAKGFRVEWVVKLNEKDIKIIN